MLIENPTSVERYLDGPANWKTVQVPGLGRPITAHVTNTQAKLRKARATSNLTVAAINEAVVRGFDLHSRSEHAPRGAAVRVCMRDIGWGETSVEISGSAIYVNYSLERGATPFIQHIPNDSSWHVRGKRAKTLAAWEVPLPIGLYRHCNRLL